MSEQFNERVVMPVPPSAESATRNQPERRGRSRYLITVAAEVFDLRSTARVAGRCSDLGLGGCYVDTLSPFAAGSPVRVRIEREKRLFEAEAIVAYAHVPMGMGLRFTQVNPEYQAVLGAWIAELSGEPVPESAASALSADGQILAAIENLRQGMNELIDMMARRKMVSEEERKTLLRRIFH